MTSTFRWESMAIAGTGTLPATPAGPWEERTDEYGAPEGTLSVGVAWMPAGNVTIPVACTATTGGAAGAFFSVVDGAGDPVPVADAGGATDVPGLGLVVAVVQGEIRPVFTHVGGPLTLRAFLYAGMPGTATFAWQPAEMGLPGDATVPVGAAAEWAAIDPSSTTVNEPAGFYGPSGPWVTDEGDGTTLIVTATGLADGQEIVVPVRPQAGQVRVQMVSPANFRPALIDPGGATPDPTGEGIRIAGPDLDAPRWRMVAAGDIEFTIELVGTEAERVITYAPWTTPTSSGGPDPIANIVSLLADELGVTVASRRPATDNLGSEPTVVVRAAGGQLVGVVADNPTVTVEAWAPTTTEAAALLRQARNALRVAAQQNRAGLYRYREFAGPADLPDPDTTNPRYTLTASLVTRADL